MSDQYQNFVDIQKAQSPCWLTLELTYINDNKLVCYFV
jgi:hypothetical protein